MGTYIDLKTISFESLYGAVGIYPWFAAARKELCCRMSKLGDWSNAQYADAAMYIPSREKITELLKQRETADCSDGDVAEIIKKYIAEEHVSEERQQEESGNKEEKRIYVLGGDYFSIEQYEKVRNDDVVPHFGRSGKNYPAIKEEDAGDGIDMAFCTETLAQIYAEQGYYEQAIEIYSKLILAYPEKNVYFAALIEKLNKEIKN